MNPIPITSAAKKISRLVLLREVFKISFFAILILCFILPRVHAQFSSADSSFVKEIFNKIVAKIEAPPDYEWPPLLLLRPTSIPNAGSRSSFDKFSQKYICSVSINKGLLDSITGHDADLLAITIGHELAHIILGHCVDDSLYVERINLLAYSRECEATADSVGIRYAVLAGYSYEKMKKQPLAWIGIGHDRRSYQNLTSDHPTWKERLSLLDKEGSRYWSDLLTYENGVLFLQYGDLHAARQCFETVLTRLPSYSLAWANLGYTLLMEFLDLLSPTEIKTSRVGQVIFGQYYRKSIITNSGSPHHESSVKNIGCQYTASFPSIVNEKTTLWTKVVQTLTEALRLNPDLALTKENLGIAYLYRPGGAAMKEADSWLKAAVNEKTSDSLIDGTTILNFAVNAAVARMSGTNVNTNDNKFVELENSYREYLKIREIIGISSTVPIEIYYNRGILLSQSNEPSRLHSSLNFLEYYLPRTPHTSLWWETGYDHYLNVCRKLRKEPRSQEQFIQANDPQYRMITSLEIDSASTIFLSQPIDEIINMIGPGQCSFEPYPSGVSVHLSRRVCKKLGIEILASDQVLAIYLRSMKSPPIQLQARGVGQSKGIDIIIGMTKTELDRLIPNERFLFTELLDSDAKYRFYQNLGLGVKIEDGIVRELVIVNPPKMDNRL